MRAMLQDLIRHKGYVDACLLKAIREHPEASQDEEIRNLLHHCLLANRFWLTLSWGRPFVLAEESQVPESLEALAVKFRETHNAELEWISHISDEELARNLESPFFAGHRFSLAQGLMQVCMHSHGHRSQCAKRLRLLGGTPPVLDFIVWVKERPVPEWSPALASTNSTAGYFERS